MRIEFDDRALAAPFTFQAGLSFNERAGLPETLDDLDGRQVDLTSGWATDPKAASLIHNIVEQADGLHC